MKRKPRFVRIPRNGSRSLHQAAIDQDGKPRYFLNDKIPTVGGVPFWSGGRPVSPVETAYCEAGCSSAYSHLMADAAAGRPSKECRECREERIALDAERWELECDERLTLRAVPLDRRAGMLSGSEMWTMHGQRRHR